MRVMEALKAFFCSIAMAFTCFSRIPAPQVDWTPGNMRFMMAAFPLIGVIIGVFVWLWSLLCGAAGLGPLLAGAGLVLIPVGISGAIHMDGFCDVVDALSSHAEPERKREILKDPHVGAFAPICVASYLILSVAVASELMLTPEAVLVFALTFVVSRCMSSFCVLGVKRSSEQGMLASFQVSADKKPALVLVIVCFVIALGVIAFISWVSALVILVVATLVTLYIIHMARKEFGGWSGDLAGFLLQTLELAFLVALVVLQKVMLL